ncbi:MAG TPA: ABC transporter ATP-binding protein [Actinomycetota bacterium]|nr:ABC transporter ATP-binding protein [Actinomycetota bacterium]
MSVPETFPQQPAARGQGGAMLEVRDLGIRFGGLQALGGVNVDVNEWEIVGLIGPNGAGKTTFFNCVMGVYAPTTGSVRYRDKEITTLPTHRRTTLGLGRTFQNVGLAKRLTVMENMLIAQHTKAAYGVVPAVFGTPAVLAEEKLLRRNAFEILDFMGLADHHGEIVSSLPYGLQKLSEIAAVLAGDPEFLLLDEPTSGMSPEEAHVFGDLLLRLRTDLNLTVLMIEHHVPLVVRVCDYVYVLNFGQLLAEGLPQQIQRHPEVVAAYLGEDADAAS